jgi:hypothetical protein
VVVVLGRRLGHRRERSVGRAAGGVCDGCAECAPRGAASWSPLDANGSSSSGSILLQDFGVGLAFQQLQCIPVKRSTPYLFGAKVRTGSGNERGNGIIAWFNYPAADCSGSFTSQVIRELRPDAPALWQQFSFATVTGSRTEGVILVIASSADVTSFDTWFDDVFVLP